MALRRAALGLAPRLLQNVGCAPLSVVPAHLHFGSREHPEPAPAFNHHVPANFRGNLGFCPLLAVGEACLLSREFFRCRALFLSRSLRDRRSPHHPWTASYYSGAEEPHGCHNVGLSSVP
jgi:hypothetical protein